MVKSTKDVEEGKAVAVLSYLLVGIIWFFVDEKMRKNSFAKFHVQQALVLIIFSIAIAVLNAILAAIIGVIVLVTLGIGSVLMIIPTLVALIPLVLWIFGIIYSATGVEKRLPVIGRFGEKFKL